MHKASRCSVSLHLQSLIKAFFGLSKANPDISLAAAAAAAAWRGCGVNVKEI